MIEVPTRVVSFLEADQYQQVWTKRDSQCWRSERGGIEVVFREDDDGEVVCTVWSQNAGQSLGETVNPTSEWLDEVLP
jgi:hypothetical protein